MTSWTDNVKCQLSIIDKLRSMECKKAMLIGFSIRAVAFWRVRPRVVAMAVDIFVVVVAVLTNWQEASVYFWLAVVSGLLIFSSCVLGGYLSRQSAPPPVLTPYISRAPSRAHSMHALSYMTTPASRAPTLKMHSPTFSSYSRATLMDQMDCSGKVREVKGCTEETEEGYPWIFVQNDGRQEFRHHQLMWAHTRRTKPLVNLRIWLRHV